MMVEHKGLFLLTDSYQTRPVSILPPQTVSRMIMGIIKFLNHAVKNRAKSGALGSSSLHNNHALAHSLFGGKKWDVKEGFINKTVMCGGRSGMLWASFSCLG